LVSFTAQTKNQSVELNWLTASEENNEGFHIERRKENKEWEAIGFVKGRGTSATTNHYSFLDNNPIAGVNYYRLRQVDFDAAFEYSKVVSAEVKGRLSSFKVFPNPVPAGVTSMQIQMERGEDGLLEIFDLQGRKVFVQEIVSNEDAEMLVPVNLGNLSEGLYLLTFKTGGEILTERLILEK
jgi:hypothetical protein